MRIGIDVSPLSGGHAGRGTGIYTKELVSALKTYTDVDIVELKKKDKNLNIDLIHYPFFDPFLLTLPLKKEKPTIVTIHDLIPIVFSKHFPRGIKGELIWQIQKKSVKAVTAIITDSEASKKDIHHLLNFDSERIHVVYLAPSQFFNPQPKEIEEQVKNKYKLSEKFVLYVGDVNWNKNIPTLIKAMKNIEKELVLVGKSFLNDSLQEVQEINSLIESNGIISKVRKLGFVPAEDLAAIYSAAGVYVQPSIAEGFGFPVLEAMACGTLPVISSSTSLPEIGGPSLLVDPLNVRQMSEAIKEGLLTDKKAIEKKLVTWAKSFTWERTAKETATVYRNYC